MFVGYRGKRIVTVSDVEFSSPSLTVIKLDPLDLARNSILTDYEVRHGKVVRKDAPYKASEIKVAFMGVYNIQCGIST